MSPAQNKLQEDQALDVEEVVAASPRRSKPLWRNRDFLLLVSGQAVSSVGSQVSLIAFPLLILALTNSPIQTGLITALRGLPFALFCLPAGALIDRWDRKRVMILCDIGRAIALVSIPVALVFGHLTYIQLYTVSLVEGTLFVFFNLAETACLPHVVMKGQLSAAVAQNEVLYSVSSVIGPALGPILYGIGSTIPFLADGISYAASAFSLFFIKTKFQEERDAEPHKLWAEIGEGMSWLWHNPLVRFIAVLTFGLITPCSGYVLIIIILARDLHATNVITGLIFAGGGIGSVVGALLVVPLQKRFSFGQLMIGTAWLWVLGWLLYAFALNPWILLAANVVSFIVVPIYMMVQFSYRLALIPDRLQGRVNSVFRLIAFGSQPIGL
ncbi:MAG TPA: MFS transporter, partial [Ktedonobacter sp.]|nr:MFS transporter [Ktedonobacter sp.]